MTTFNAVPNPVDNFTLDRDELEYILAPHYFNVRLNYEYDRFAYDELGIGISNSEWGEYAQASYRLEAIEKFLGAEKMTVIKRRIEVEARRKVGEKNWADFTGQTGQGAEKDELVEVTSKEEFAALLQSRDWSIGKPFVGGLD
jgi:hypothetical protein